MIIWCLCCFCFFNAIFFMFCVTCLIKHKKDIQQSYSVGYFSKLCSKCRNHLSFVHFCVQDQLHKLRSSCPSWKNRYYSHVIFSDLKKPDVWFVINPKRDIKEITLQKWHCYDLRYTSKCILSLSIVPPKKASNYDFCSCMIFLRQH